MWCDMYVIYPSIHPLTPVMRHGSIDDRLPDEYQYLFISSSKLRLRDYVSVLPEYRSEYYSSILE